MPTMALISGEASSVFVTLDTSVDTLSSSQLLAMRDTIADGLNISTDHVAVSLHMKHVVVELAFAGV